MKLDAFPRYPLLFGPSPVHPLRRLSALLGDRRSGPSGMTATAGSPTAATRRGSWSICSPMRSPRGATPWFDRRGPVQPHPAGRGGRGPGGKRCSVRSIGWTGPIPCTIESATSSEPDSRCGRAPPRRVQHRHPRELATGARRGRGTGGKPYPIPAGASDHRLGGLGYTSFASEVEIQERELGVFFDT